MLHGLSLFLLLRGPIHETQAGPGSRDAETTCVRREASWEGAGGISSPAPGEDSEVFAQLFPPALPKTAFHS